jgi:hypothetical protein
VKIQWLNAGALGQDFSWLKIDPRLMEYKKVKLGFDYIATKNIKEGDELFLDYGDEWEQAWQQHVLTWEPPPGSKTYAPAQRWNERFFDSPIRTNREQEWDPYPSHIFVRCHRLLRNRPRSTLREFLWELGDKGLPCEILDRYQDDKEGKTVYDVKVDIYDENDYLYRNRRYRWKYRRLPRSAIRYVNRPYSSDFQQLGVFRHLLGVPDDMLPDAWQNVHKPPWEPDV